jgi:phosphoglycerate dehydrogenase-like enzyme
MRYHFDTSLHIYFAHDPREPTAEERLMGVSSVIETSHIATATSYYNAGLITTALNSLSPAEAEAA